MLIDDAINAGGRVSEEMATHIDSCLGCLACVSSCPSGVRYDELLDRARPEVARQQTRPRTETVIREISTFPRSSTTTSS